MRINILLACVDCKRRNYSTQKNKKNTTAKLEISKFCPFVVGTESTAKQNK